MYPIKTHSLLTALVIVAALAAVEAPNTFAHGGGGHGGGHGSHSVGGGGFAPSGAYYHALPNYHGYGTWPYLGRAGTTMPSQPVWEGFPDDLPFARLQRFVAGHVHHWHWPSRHVS